MSSPKTYIPREGEDVREGSTELAPPRPMAEIDAERRRLIDEQLARNPDTYTPGECLRFWSRIADLDDEYVRAFRRAYSFGPRGGR